MQLDIAAGTPPNPDYFVLVRRRWIKTMRITTNNTPATTWIIVVLPIAIPPSLNDSNP
jgi:hypothetical protein